MANLPSYETLGDWQQALHHAVQGQDWSTVTRQLTAQVAVARRRAGCEEHAGERSPRQLLSSPAVSEKQRLDLGDIAGAYRTIISY
jgi:hypothetical protein